MYYKKVQLFAIPIVLALLVSAMTFSPALADDGDGNPTPPADTSSEVAPATDPAPDVAPAADTSAVDASTPATDDAASTDVAPADDSAAPAADDSSSVLASLPDNTDVVVLDSNGDSLPLASQEAADVIATGDPIWCPASVSMPVSGGSGCSPSEASFQGLGGLIFWLFVNDPAQAGTIWIEKTYSDTAALDADVTLDGSAFINVQNYALTIKGGWNGLGTNTIDTSSPSTFNTSFSIINWAGNITLSDIVVNGSSNSGTTTYALNVSTTKNIVVNDVTVQNSLNIGAGVMNGAVFNNYVGSSGSGTITVSNSSFNKNEGYGAFLDSNNVVTTNNVVANQNGTYGLYIDNRSSLGDKGVVMKGNKNFSFNGGDGLYIATYGSITLSNIVATQNGGDGVYLDNTGSASHQGITLGGMNYFTSNGSNGLEAYSEGAITVSNVNANDNGSNGAYIDNCDISGGYCQAPQGKGVKLSGYNNFIGNSSFGLNISSLGSITVSNLTASDNGDTGAGLYNQYHDNTVSHLRSKGTITLTGYGTFNSNVGDGLSAASYTNFVGANLTAEGNSGTATDCSSGNNGCGVYLDLYGNATLTGVNTFAHNHGAGLYIYGDGKVAASNILSHDNGADGAYIATYLPSATVTLTGNNTFTYNALYGLKVVASGAITISNLTANNNSSGGALLDNTDDPTKPQNVTLKGNSSFWGNANGSGLDIETYGAIVVNNLTSTGNGSGSGDNGAYLNNYQAGGTLTPKPVTLTGYANLSSNYQDGLVVYSLGAITVNNVIANNNLNGGGGAWLQNNYNTAMPQNVTVKGTNSFNGNDDDGLVVYSFGTITVSNVTANNNNTLGGYGAYLDNSGGTTPKNIVLTGVNNFYNNYYDGIYVSATGSVTLSRVTAQYNNNALSTYAGIEAYAGGSITLVCAVTTYQSPGGYGYYLSATGPVVIKGVYSYNNASDYAAGSTVSITYPCILP